MDAKDLIENYIQFRSSQDEQYLKYEEQVYQKFFIHDKPDLIDAQNWVRDRMNETVLSVSEDGEDFEVVTTGSGLGKKLYTVSSIGETELRIRAIDVECSVCMGLGVDPVDSDCCKHCGGSGWVHSVD